MARKKTNPHIGSSFDAFLAEQGILEDCEYQALKEMLADQVKAAMAKSGSLKQRWRHAWPPAAGSSTVCSIQRSVRTSPKHDGESGTRCGARIAPRTCLT